MSGPFDNKGRGAGGVLPNLSDRLDRPNLGAAAPTPVHAGEGVDTRHKHHVHDKRPAIDCLGCSGSATAFLDDPGPIEVIERRESDGHIR